MLPDRQVASSAGTGALVIGGPHPRRTGAYVHYEIYGSASGGRPHGDGVSGVSVHLGNSQIAPIEIVESEFPVRVRQFALRADSGGAGQHRGGLGYRREYEILADGTRLSLRMDRHRIGAPGVRGGEGGEPGSVTVWRNGALAAELPSRLGGFILQAGDVLRVDRPGAGGFGSPAARDPERVRADLADGYVTPPATGISGSEAEERA
jgi:N-methylhydantoinase B